MQVTPSQLVTLLNAGIPARLPFLITGAPGIGKTDIVEEIAQSLGFIRMTRIIWGILWLFVGPATPRNTAN